MGTQHADEVSSNASFGGKFDGSYSVFGRRPLRGMHDALVGKSLDLSRMTQDALLYQLTQRDFARRSIEWAKFFHAKSTPHS